MINLNDLIATTEVEGGQEGNEIEVPVEQVDNTEPISYGTDVGGDGESPITKEEAKELEKLNIDGEEYSVDDIREWRKGNLRQSDYTKKTTELAKQRAEHKDAVEMYEYLKSKPELLQELAKLDQAGLSKEKVIDKLDPTTKRVQDLEIQLKMKDIDVQLQKVISKDKSVSEVELLEVANDYGVDVEKAYNIWRGLNIDKILKTETLKTKQSVAKEIQNNNGITKTLITNSDTKNEGNNHGLTDTQMLMCQKLDMTPEDYVKYMSNPQ